MENLNRPDLVSKIKLKADIISYKGPDFLPPGCVVAERNNIMFVKEWLKNKKNEEELNSIILSIHDALWKNEEIKKEIRLINHG